MFSRFNWGHGITLFYIVFVAVLITALIASFSVDHSLVVDDYYAQDLAYQSQYDKSKNYIKSDILKLSQDNEEQIVHIDFDSADPITGKVYWYRPSDQSADFIVQLTDRNTDVSTVDLQKGKWILKIEYSTSGKSFYSEKQIFVA